MFGIIFQVLCVLMTIPGVIKGDKISYIFLGFCLGMLVSSLTVVYFK